MNATHLDNMLERLEAHLNKIVEDATQGNTVVEIYGPASALQIVYGSARTSFKDFELAARSGTFPEKTRIYKAFQAKWVQATGGKGSFYEWLAKNYGRNDTQDVDHSPDLTVRNSDNMAFFKPDGPAEMLQGTETYVPANKII